MRWIWKLLIFCLLASPIQAEFETVWSLGVWDGDPQDEYGETTWEYNAAPGSATALDNDFYLAGSYPAPIGTVTGEPQTNFEPGLDGQNRSVRLHFNLTTAQATNTARMRLNMHQVWGGHWNELIDNYGEGYGIHQFEVLWNGVLLKTAIHTQSDTLIVEVNAGTFTPIAGANTLEIRRSAPPASSSDGWISFDALSLEIDPLALWNEDSDGLPRWWEQDHGLSDRNTADAALDGDHDGRTNVQEFAAQTLPHNRDTDDDGLSDGAEFTAGTNPLNPDTDGDSLSDGEETDTDPLVADTDSDGAGDAWELRTGYSANSPTNMPPNFSRAIGIHVVSELNPKSALGAVEVAGVVPQRFWNNTWALSDWRSRTGTQGDIVSPVADVIVNSAGLATGMTMAWDFTGSVWATGQGGSSTQKLLDGYFNVSSDTAGSLTLSGIPFATYDVIVYVGSTYDGALGNLRLNDNPATDRWLLTASMPPQTRLVELVKSDAAAPWRANVIRYRNVTGTNVNLKLSRTSWHELGIHGVQIVDSLLDSDADGMTDAFEWQYQLKPDLADATPDTDGDGLSNLAEMTRRTNPRLADTDGDGLTDAVETNTGIWANAGNTGSDPLIADTDDDGLTDGDEVSLVPAPTNPNLADSDGDGREDLDEVRGWTNPVAADASNAQMPVVTTSPRTFDWTVENVQVVWNHARGGVLDQEWEDNRLMEFQIRNSSNPNSDAFNLGIRVKAGRVTHFFYSGHAGGFSDSGDFDSDIWEADWEDLPTDLKAAMGFSGAGKVDISDRLRFRITGSSAGSRTAWNFTFSITNQDTNAIVVSRSYTNSALAQNVHDGSATWQDSSDPPQANRLSLSQHAGVEVFFNSIPLENTTAFAAFKDTDEDGMPDVWEDAQGLNKNSAADASLDGDADGLTNRREYLAGTSPTDGDSDNDLARDGLEVDSGSNPLLSASLPPFFRGLPGGVMGEDLNGNGFSDGWEQWVGRFNLISGNDDDGDGMTNGSEAVAGTNALDAGSLLWTDAIGTATTMTMRWPLLAGKSHRVMQSADFLSWSPAPGLPSITEGEHRQTFGFEGPNTFYRVSVKDQDLDTDGVSDWTELNVTGSVPGSANSKRGAVSMDVNGDGTAESSLSGDYVALIEQLQGANSGGGFPGGGGAGAISGPQAARFLTQATFGPTVEEIQRVQTLGYAGWITEQMGLPATRHSDYITTIFDDLTGQRSRSDYIRGGEDDDPFLFGGNMQTAFARAAIQGPDQLRQRVAFALSQILVTSRRDANLENRCLGMADYYDIFVRNGFGNYEDVLMEVTMHPVMGRYLSHVGNQKADPAINRYPDENYAREVMQLFTVGLWALNPDGSRQLNALGAPIPTYSNTEITNLARVLTGFWFGGHTWGGGGWTEQDYATPMTLHAERHDFGAKTLLQNFVIPARAASPENAKRDVRDAIHHLFMHPNTGVFVGKQLIQFLVTDNPSPGYVQRIGEVFKDNGSGVRGDLAAVVRAILLDAEARGPVSVDMEEFGRLKEPVIRAMAMARVLGLRDVPDLLWWDWGEFYNESRQAPTNSPSVFNFYRPEYRAPGLLTQNSLAGPVFQITDSFSSISFPNRLWEMLEEGFSLYDTYEFPLGTARESDLAASPERLMDHFNLLFCAGQMAATTRAHILGVIAQIPSDQTAARVRVAAYLALTCPEGAVMR